MDEKRLKHCLDRINSNLPLLGKAWRRAAAAELAADGSVAAMPHLVAALDNSDADVREIARAALLTLGTGAPADALCAAWASSRSAQVGQILQQRKLTASQPAALRMLTACWCGTVQVSTRDDVGDVAALINDRQPEIRTAATAALKGLQRASLQSALCELAIAAPDGEVAGLCKECGYIPVDDERACLYLFVTRQLDTFFERDPDFSHLGLEYDRADAALKARIMEVVQGGDVRCLGIFGRRKALQDCTDAEIAITLNSARKHQEWDALWRYFKELPLRLSEEIIDWLAAANWRPEDDSEAALFDSICSLRRDGYEVVAAAAAGEPSLIDRWIEAGKAGELARLDTPQLMQRLAVAAPHDAVQVVGALAGKIKPGSQEARLVAQSEHWLVRLAACAVGLWSGDTSADPNYWVRELAAAASVMDLWPERRTPGVLREMQSLPRDAFTGRLGSKRRIVMELIAFSLDRASWVRQRQEGIILTRQ